MDMYDPYPFRMSCPTLFLKKDKYSFPCCVKEKRKNRRFFLFSFTQQGKLKQSLINFFSVSQFVSSTTLLTTLDPLNAPSLLLSTFFSIVIFFLYDTLHHVSGNAVGCKAVYGRGNGSALPGTPLIANPAWLNMFNRCVDVKKTELCVRAEELLKIGGSKGFTQARGIRGR